MNLNTNYLLLKLLLLIPFFVHAQLEHADLGIAFTHAKENKTWNSDYIILNDSLSFKQHSYYDPIFIEIIVFEPKVNNQGSLSNMNQLINIHLEEFEDLRKKNDSKLIINKGENGEFIRATVKKYEKSSMTYGIRMFIHNKYLIKIKTMAMVHNSYGFIPKEFTDIECISIN